MSSRDYFRGQRVRQIANLGDLQSTVRYGTVTKGSFEPPHLGWPVVRFDDNQDTEVAANPGFLQLLEEGK